MFDFTFVFDERATMEIAREALSHVHAVASDPLRLHLIFATPSRAMHEFALLYSFRETHTLIVEDVSKNFISRGFLLSQPLDSVALFRTSNSRTIRACDFATFGSKVRRRHFMYDSRLYLPKVEEEEFVFTNVNLNEGLTMAEVNEALLLLEMPGHHVVNLNYEIDQGGPLFAFNTAYKPRESSTIDVFDSTDGFASEDFLVRTRVPIKSFVTRNRHVLSHLKHTGLHFKIQHIYFDVDMRAPGMFRNIHRWMSTFHAGFEYNVGLYNVPTLIEEFAIQVLETALPSKIAIHTFSGDPKASFKVYLRALVRFLSRGVPRFVNLHFSWDGPMRAIELVWEWNETLRSLVVEARANLTVRESFQRAQRFVLGRYPLAVGKTQTPQKEIDHRFRRLGDIQNVLVEILDSL